ncbi:hypothetical protein V8G54_002949 [Vigna mungo]|uniref:Uncharacterized protein n=1 Tax=Vigna mungo TaxID=3915 RepID=A0AAQ3P9N1_VIGMU
MLSTSRSGIRLCCCFKLDSLSSKLCNYPAFILSKFVHPKESYNKSNAMRYASFKNLINNFNKINLLSKRQSHKQINITYVQYITFSRRIDTHESDIYDKAYLSP